MPRGKVLLHSTTCWWRAIVFGDPMRYSHTPLQIGSKSSPASPLPPRIAIGTVVAGKFRVERILAEGGMGVVVAATHLQLDQAVAVKFLRDEVSADKEA